MEEISVEELFNRVRERMREIPHEKVYFALRSMRLKHITLRTVEIAKAFVALESLGVPITVYTVAEILNTTRTAALENLHRFGDKQVLTLIRRRGYHPYVWILSPLFKKRLGLA